MFTMICLASYTRFDNIGIENTESITTHKDLDLVYLTFHWHYHTNDKLWAVTVHSGLRLGPLLTS